MAFKLTYATMFNPPEELHKGFDKAVAALKANLGREYGMIIDGKDVFADEKFEDRSPVNTNWVLARMQKGNATHAQTAIAAARKRRAIVDLARLLDAPRSGGDMTDEEAAELAAAAKREVRSRRR